MFHTEVFSSSNGTSGANTFIQITYLSAGAVLPTQNLGLTVMSDIPYLAQVFGVGAHMCHIRPQANSMLPFPYPMSDPVNRGTAFESPPRTWDLSMVPMPLRPSEEFDIFNTQNSGGAETQYIGVNFSSGPAQPLAFPLNPGGALTGQPVPGRAFTAHATATATLSAGAWTQVTPTFDQTLPAGLYGIIGLRTFSATGLFTRVRPAMDSNRRAGGIAVQAYDAMDPPWQRMINYYGRAVAPMGIWHTFYQNVPPYIDIFATAGDTAEEFWFDMVYLGTQVMPGV